MSNFLDVPLSSNGPSTITKMLSSTTVGANGVNKSSSDKGIGGKKGAKKGLIQVIGEDDVSSGEELGGGKKDNKKKIKVVEDDSSSDEDEDADAPPPIFDAISFALDGGDSSSSSSVVKGEVAEEGGPSLMEEMMKEAEEERKKKKEEERKKTAKRAKKFGGGLKGGFFDKPKKGKKKKKAAEKKEEKKAEKEEEVFELSPDGEIIPTITKNATKPSRNPLVFDDVQKALGSDPAGMLDKNKEQWATQSLTDKIMKNPRLAMGMSNPMFLQAIEDMKADPEGAKRKYKGRKEIEDFLREFMGVMGEHFMEMGKKEEGEKGESAQGGVGGGMRQGPDLGPLAKEAIERQAEREAKGEVGWDDSASKEKVDDIVKDSEISGLLMDPEMQRVLHECGRPGVMGRYMNDEVWGPKIKKLIDRGLIKIEK